MLYLRIFTLESRRRRPALAVLAIFPKETAASVTSETRVRQKSSLKVIRLKGKGKNGYRFHLSVKYL